MKKNLLQRVIIITVVTLIALWIVIGPRGRAPRLADFTPRGINNTLRNNIRLGLDLKGGSHLLMQVQVPEYLRSMTKNVGMGMLGAAQEAGYPVKNVRPEIAGDSYRIVFEAGEGADIQKIRNELPTKVGEFDPSVWSASVQGSNIIWEMTDAAKTILGDRAVEQAKQIIDARINAVGVAEPTLSDHGSRGAYQLLLQMPGVQDPQRVKDMLKAQSKLELVYVLTPPAQAYPTKEMAEATLANLPPIERQKRRVLPYVERDRPAVGQTEEQKKEPTWVVVEAPAVIEGSDLTDARAEQGEGGADVYQIGFNLNPRGAEKFGAWTLKNIGNYMGVVLSVEDDSGGREDRDRDRLAEVKSIATIQSQITDSGRITGNFSQRQAEDLALTLRSGALQAPIKYLEDRTVGPTLGADSIRAGVNASVAGLVFVVIFMVIYYKGAGINAVIALLLNTLLTLAALIWPLDATLTLPGIAGLILSVGMTVDTNVLIFERIREELLTGKTVTSSVDQGFARAFVTIIDTHVTTIVAALFLFVFGSGPIRGFAITLIIGLVANLFSAVYVSRTIFMWVLGRKKRAESLSI